MPNNSDYAWVGSSQKLYEHTGTLAFTEMGARVYLPALGRFVSVDPVEGGVDNAYVYPCDPVNGCDLTGRWSWCSVLKVTAVVAGVAGAIACGVSVVCAVAVGAAAGTAAYLAERAGTEEFSWCGLGTAAIVGGASGLLRFGAGGAMGRAALNAHTLGKASHLFGRASSGSAGAFSRGALRVGWEWKGSAKNGVDVSRVSWSRAGYGNSSNHIDLAWRR